MIDTNLTLSLTDTFHVEPESRDLVAGWILTMMLKQLEFYGNYLESVIEDEKVISKEICWLNAQRLFWH